MEKLKNILKLFAKQKLNVLVKQILETKETKEFILSLNKQQLKNGIDSNNIPLSFYRPYSQSYKIYKGSDTVDLYDTGRFYETFNVKILDNGFEIVADTTLYKKDFKDIYGENVLGLTPESMKMLEKHLQTKLSEKLLKLLS